MNNTTKTVIVTGASSGLGFAIANAYLKRGYHVIGNASTQASLDRAADNLGNPAGFHGVAGDISLSATSERLFGYAEQHGLRVDILIINAGIFIAKPLTDYAEVDITRMLDINLRGFIYPAQAAAKHMMQHGGGHIVAVTAAIGMQPNANLPALLPVLTKGGLNQAVKALAIELAPHNIMVNAVAPGVIATPMHADNLQAREALQSMAPVQRIGEPQDVAEAVLYLTDASFVTGTILPVDGGSTAGVW
ncbi:MULTISPECIES: SDR family NAD(P)-dependent oxidoreductase [unclassified Serratia (in: enterobacteria)]|uniref:SDR family NAD(P)-dependent oxidoreductase n=1 Tax=unclassified Serratia (in: enterobacteria) TaxID=2647522 RepID=UPI000468F704|nr:MULTISPECIES: SDR family NAD(P)-dependent oxidoreductase [unclassified Serratia (in: enterobacteria)]